eukprot:TRINITY_DN1338_c0_g1_i23.p1 TRINITY_DN1338_c0_g1~~TRINITY_DN1338_c0_g1_i23.p1  ORF type:complete len:101 (+),score=15.48 TRINITY_DN1338_c0_g1_i23:204-506(+)
MWFTQSSPSFVRQPNLKNQGLPLKTKINVIETFENYEQAIKVLDEIQRAVKNAGVLPDQYLVGWCCSVIVLVLKKWKFRKTLVIGSKEEESLGIEEGSGR